MDPEVAERIEQEDDKDKLYNVQFRANTTLLPQCKGFEKEYYIVLLFEVPNH